MLIKYTVDARHKKTERNQNEPQKKVEALRRHESVIFHVCEQRRGVGGRSVAAASEDFTKNQHFSRAPHNSSRTIEQNQYGNFCCVNKFSLGSGSVFVIFTRFGFNLSSEQSKSELSRDSTKQSNKLQPPHRFLLSLLPPFFISTVYKEQPRKARKKQQQQKKTSSSTQ